MRNVHIVMYEPEHSDYTAIHKLSRAFGVAVMEVGRGHEAAAKVLGTYGYHVALEKAASHGGMWLDHFDPREPRLYDPERPIFYWVGPNNGTIPNDLLELMDAVVEVETPLDRALAPVTALAIVLYKHALVTEEMFKS